MNVYGVIYLDRDFRDECKYYGGDCGECVGVNPPECFESYTKNREESDMSKWNKDKAHPIDDIRRAVSIIEGKERSNCIIKGYDPVNTPFSDCTSPGLLKEVNMSSPERYMIKTDCHGELHESVKDQEGQWIFDPEHRISISYYASQTIKIDRKEASVFGDFFRPDPKVLPWRSKEYLDHVKEYPCCSCGFDPPASATRQIAPHHVSLKNTGHSTKCPDFQTIPLCKVCHQLDHCGQGMPMEDKLKAMVKCLGDWVQDVERIFKGLV